MTSSDLHKTASGLKRRGPKPRGATAMTGAERTRKYRERRQDDVLFEAHEMMTPVVLREALSRALASVDQFAEGRVKLGGFADLKDDMNEGALYLAERLWREVGRRYGLTAGRKSSR